MRSSSPLTTAILTAAAILLTALPSEASRIRRGPTAPRHKVTKADKSPHQRAIDDTRAMQIQGALVKAGYLSEASGHWDNASEAAMQKMQGDNGWQTKIVPDSRALIKLGLGPNAELATAPLPVAGVTDHDAAQDQSEEVAGK
ncbi:peptidoglycan-binding protein [Terriglobus roseus]|uniref:Putative peptidoglycan binding domain-containing protein n=1 Tax=Terriglobus roseus TaxID=392734 RepID=A0A1H4TF54_9BACT|nr:peptidoglycan-binding protein [Terriglobus roseus]SEC55153.1 Putative peptidoglycan binding domain-containing protein [Terriglobus roseus]